MKKLIKKLVLKLLQNFARHYVRTLRYYWKVYTDKFSREWQLEQIMPKGKHVYIHPTVTITDPMAISLSNNVSIGANCYLLTQSGLYIGVNTKIGRNVNIYTVQPQDRLGSGEIKDQPVFIGKGVYIADNVVITPGITISDNALIETGCIINKDIPENAIVRQADLQITIKEGEGVIRDKLGYTLNEDSCNVRKDGDGIFFILSTGRSGSQAIARTLNSHPDVECYHEPRGPLIRLSAEYAHGLKDQEQVKKELTFLYQSGGLDEKSVYGESDMCLVPLIDVLIEVLPKARFIWQIRDARNVISSGVGRKWFDDIETQLAKPEDWEKRGWNYYYYRFDGKKMGLLDSEVWESMDTFEKNCWYWAYANMKIKTAFEGLAPERKMTVKLEEVDVSKIFEFLGVSESNIQMKVTNKRNYKVVDHLSWTENQKEKYEKWCGDLMNQIYGAEIND